MSTMKNEYPILFNDTEIPFPTTWSESSNVIETKFETEAGTDEIIVTRDDKITVSASFKVLSPWVVTFGTFARLTSFTLTRYNPSKGEYEERTVRLRNFKYDLVKNSQDLDMSATTGVWQVSFTLEEF